MTNPAASQSAATCPCYGCWFSGRQGFCGCFECRVCERTFPAPLESDDGGFRCGDCGVRVVVRDEDEITILAECTLGQFIADNGDAVTAEEIAQIRAGYVVKFGGGASPVSFVGTRDAEVAS